MDARPTLGIVGTGKVGSSLARLWYGVGYDVRAVFSPKTEQAGEVARQVDAESASSPSEVVAKSDLSILSVPDDRIEAVVTGLKDNELTGKGIVHTSGVHDRRALEALAQAGAMTGSLHPAFPFAHVETALDNLPGAAFAVEAEDMLLHQWLVDMVRALDGQVMVIPPGKKALYHAALAIASNYTVTLYALAEQLLQQLGVERVAADRALNTLVTATVENVKSNGIPNALTGPLVRADVGTIEKHLKALGQVDERLVRVYVALARLSFPMLQARDIPVEAIERVLGEDE